MSDLRTISPLSGHGAPHNLVVSVTEIADRGMIDLRGNPENGSFAAAVESVLDGALPRQPRTCATSGNLSVLWLSVDQWLVQCPRDQTADFARRLNEALAGIPSLVVDVSDARSVIRLEGEGVREILMKGAPVDLTAPAFSQGTVRRVRFGELAAMVHMVGEAPDVIELFVFRSYAIFAWDWLIATAGEAAQVRLYQPQAAPTA